VVYGTQRNADAAAMKDIDSRELWLLAPIAAAVLWMGIYPESFMRPMRADVGRLVDRLERSTPPSDAHLTKGKAPAAKAPTSHAPAESH
jgi:NADH-quinone oxidoreductase subunit M